MCYRNAVTPHSFTTGHTMPIQIEVGLVCQVVVALVLVAAVVVVVGVVAQAAKQQRR